MRALEKIPKFVRKHVLEKCSSWPLGNRSSSIPIGFTAALSEKQTDGVEASPVGSECERGCIGFRASRQELREIAAVAENNADGVGG